MLNKQICKQCLVHHYSQRKTFGGYSWPADYVEVPIAMFEVHWERWGKIICININSEISIYSHPPKECPYILEHMVNEVESYEDMIRAY